MEKNNRFTTDAARSRANSYPRRAESYLYNDSNTTFPYHTTTSSVTPGYIKRLNCDIISYIAKALLEDASGIEEPSLRNPDNQPAEALRLQSKI